MSDERHRREHSNPISPNDRLFDFDVKPRKGEEEEEEESDEALAPNRLKETAKPSAEEVAAHMISHMPYRDWCPHCVRGPRFFGGGCKPRRAAATLQTSER